MATNKPIVLYPGSHTAVGSGLAVAKIVWAEQPVSGSAVVRDGTTTIAILSRAKGAPEQSAVIFNPPITVTSGAVHAFASGGFLQVYLQGQSGYGG